MSNLNDIAALIRRADSLTGIEARGRYEFAERKLEQSLIMKSGLTLMSLHNIPDHPFHKIYDPLFNSILEGYKRVSNNNRNYM